MSLVLGVVQGGLLRTTRRTTLEPMTGTSNDEIAAWSVICVPFSIVGRDGVVERDPPLAAGRDVADVGAGALEQRGETARFVERLAVDVRGADEVRQPLGQPEADAKTGRRAAAQVAEGELRVDGLPGLDHPAGRDLEGAKPLGQQGRAGGEDIGQGAHAGTSGAPPRVRRPSYAGIKMGTAKRRR